MKICREHRLFIQREAGLIDFDKLKERFKELKEADAILKEIDLEDEPRGIQNIIDYFFEEEKRKEFIKRIYKDFQADSGNI